MFEILMDNGSSSHDILSLQVRMQRMILTMLGTVALLEQ